MTASRKLSREEYKRRYLERQAWIDWMQARRDLSLTAKLIGGRIGLHKNLETGRCDPGAGTLADEAGIHERAAFRAISELERKGCIAIERTRGGAKNNANRYTLLMLAEAPTGDTVSGVRAPKRTRVRGDKRDSAGVTPCQANNEENNTGEGEPNGSPLPVERERARARDPLDGEEGPPAGRPLPLFDQAEPPEIIPDAEPAARPQDPTRGEDADYSEPEILDPNSRQQDPSAGRGVVAIADERALRELLACWDRGYVSDDDPRTLAVIRVEFRKACSRCEGGGSAILGAARIWVDAAKKADGVAYLPRLARWLAGDCWAKAPTVKKRQRSGRPERRGSSTHMMRTALKFGGYVEDQDGNLYHPDGMQGSSIYWRAS